MAVYAATVTSLMKRAVKVDQVTGYGMFTGRCDLTNYNATLAAITAITGKFKDVISVVPQGVSDNGFLVEWIDASGAFKAYTFDYDAVADGAAIEAATDTDIGAFDFVAYGLV